LQLDRRMVIIYGPTGVGKSDLACAIAQSISAEIVNADMGQLYTPLSIGTAKPNWRLEKTPHHLFDVLNEPVDCSVVQYRTMLMAKLEEIWTRGNLPLVVGGSGFYIQSIFYVPKIGDCTDVQNGTWDDLNAIDPKRAASIHPHDAYRISRALSIWYSFGIKPSECASEIAVPCHADIIWVTRERAQLYERINQRTQLMIEQGWIDECRSLLGTEWELFLRRKKLIGYTEIFDYVLGKKNLQDTIDIIAQKTRAYAKRQETFWKMLKRRLTLEDKNHMLNIHELNLTLSDPCLYINQLLKRASNR
jgi:tRNA dimethylallyltransferase